MNTEYEALSFAKATAAIGDNVMVIANPSLDGDEGWDDDTTVTRSSIASLEKRDGIYYPADVVRPLASLDPRHVGAPILSTDGEILGLIQSGVGHDGAEPAVVSREITAWLQQVFTTQSATIGTPSGGSASSWFQNPTPKRVPSWEEQPDHTWEHHLVVRRQEVRVGNTPYLIGTMLKVNQAGRWDLTLEEFSRQDPNDIIETWWSLDSGSFEEQGLPFDLESGAHNHIMLISSDIDAYDLFVNGGYLSAELNTLDLQAVNCWYNQWIRSCGEIPWGRVPQ